MQSRGPPPPGQGGYPGGGYPGGYGGGAASQPYYPPGELCYLNFKV